MYTFSTSKNEVFQQGINEGRRQVLADIAKIVHDGRENAALDSSILIADDVINYLEQEGYL